MNPAGLPIAGEDTALVGSILAMVRERTGVDFTRYRYVTVRRRIGNRMASLGVTSLSAYLARVVGEEGEVHSLLGRLTIKVSRFYRNAQAFDLLRARVLPELAARAPLRLWSAGAGCGEEPYTLAMLLEEAGIAGSVLATDVDPGALEVARAGVYAPEAVAELPEALALRFLERESGGRVRVREQVRARVRLELHDLTSGASPPGPFDLVACRNVLIYLERGVHARCMAEMREAIAPGGFLLLGESEWPAPRFELTALDRRSRIFRDTSGRPR